MDLEKRLEIAKKQYEENPTPENKDALFIAGSAIRAKNGDYERARQRVKEAEQESTKINEQLRKRIREQLNGWFLHRRPSHGKSLGADGGINYVMRPEKAKWFLKHYSFTTEEWYEIQDTMSAEEQIDYLINKFNIKR